MLGLNSKHKYVHSISVNTGGGGGGYSLKKGRGNRGNSQKSCTVPCRERGLVSRAGHGVIVNRAVHCTEGGIFSKAVPCRDGENSLESCTLQGRGE